MNVYLLISPETYNYVNELAKLLKSRDDVDKIGARVVSRRTYHRLANDPDIEYDQLQCVVDVHRELIKNPVDEDRLRELRADYGRPFLTRYLNADRQYREYGLADQQRMIQNWFDFYIDLFDEFEPDFVLTSGVAASHTWIPFDLVQHYGGTALSWSTARVRDRYSIGINVPRGRFQAINERFNSYSNGDVVVSDDEDSLASAKEYLEEFRTEGSRPTYFTSSDHWSLGETLKNVAVAPARYLRYAYLYHISQSETNYIRDDYTRLGVLERIKQDATRSYRGFRVEKTDYFDSVRDDEKFAYFPLHYQPEAALMIGAPMYTNQYAAVRQVSDALPMDFTLYVKDHPSMSHRRSLDYYERLREVPNVRVIDPRLDSHEIIDRSELVTTITGTAGFEATMLRTPAIMFGDCYYNVMPLVHECGDPHDLPDIVNRALTEFEHEETQLIQFLTALFHCSFDLPPRSKATAEERARALYPQLIDQIQKVRDE